MPRYSFSQESISGLQIIFDYLEERSELAADVMQERFREAFELPAARPGIGRTRTDLSRQPLRSWPVDPYLILYRDSTKVVEIVAVLHGARDIPSVLLSRSFDELPD